MTGERARERSESTWNERARAYANLTTRWPLFGRLAERLVAPSGVDPLLDIGAGAGLLSALALERCPDRHVTLLEPSAEMRRLARERLAAWSPLIQGVSAEALSAAPGSFAAVLSSAAFHLVDEQVALPRIADALRPGGLLSFNLWWHSFAETVSEVPDGLAREPLRAALEELGLGRTPLPARAEPRTRTSADYERIGASCGLELERVDVDRDSVERRYFVEFAAMSPTLLGSLQDSVRASVIARAKELAREHILVPSVRLTLRRR